MAIQRTPDLTRNKPDPHSGKRKRRIVFIPWDFSEGQEWVIKTHQWNHATKNKYEIVNHTPRMPSRILWEASTDPACSIYIRGHGNPGIPYIQVKIGDGDVTQKILITEACQRLIDNGLTRSFPGVIKFFHCHSATILTQAEYNNEKERIKRKNQYFKEACKGRLITKKQRDEWIESLYPNKSIARNGADFLRKKGFTKCSYYGYLGPLASEYGDDGYGGFHKLAEINGLQSRPTHLVNVVTSRASQARIQV
jgi:hypothetical protein